jgi:hypothetical protein
MGTCADARTLTRTPAGREIQASGLTPRVASEPARRRAGSAMHDPYEEVARQRDSWQQEIALRGRISRDFLWRSLTGCG